MSSGVVTITDAEFETEVLQAEQPVLAYFWATWCGPCKLMTPLMAWAATEYADSLKVVKLEVDPKSAIVKQYKVEGLPALRLIKGDKLLASTEGLIGKDKIASFIEENLSSQ